MQVLENIGLFLFGDSQLPILLILSLLIFLACFSFLKKNKYRNIITLTLVYALFTFWNLGSFHSCETYYQNENEGDEVIFKVNGETEFDKIYVISIQGVPTNSTYQLYSQNVEVSGSNDLSSWQELCVLEEKEYMKYSVYENEANYTYIKLYFPNNTGVINEFALYNSDTNSFLDLEVYSATSNKYNPNNMIDETAKIDPDFDYQDETYFDEIYHVRNAYEIVHHLKLYTAVHPLLGTKMIALGIYLFGMNPFGFRFFGALTSVMSLPLFWLLAKALFGKRKYADIATLLFACDFMHYTTGRIATLEPFSIFNIILMYLFMVYFLKTDIFNNFKDALICLGLSAFAMSLAWATKWTCMYASVGLAILFFMHFINSYQAYDKPDKNTKAVKMIIFNICFFIILPIVVYVMNYYGIRMYEEDYSSFWQFLKQVYEYTIYAFTYHKGLTATHTFQSKWYMWVLNIRPIWYYVKYQSPYIQSISCFNNPAINLLGVLAFFYALVKAIKNKKKNLACYVALVGYLTTLLPWTLVSRSTFSYHYYPCIPFLILLVVYLIKNYENKYPRAIKIYLVLCIGLFILFLPLIAGFKTTTFMSGTLLQWLPTWYFGH